MIKNILLLLLFSNFSQAMIVNKCIQENGTISYQKEPCVEDTRTIAETIKDNRNKKAKKNKTKNHEKLTEKEFSQFITNNLDNISVDLKSYNISVLKIKYWTAVKKVLGDNMLHLKFSDKSKGSEFSLLIDFFLPKNNKTFTQAELDKMIVTIGEKILSESVQTQVSPIQIDVDGGIGVVANFTDANLVGKSVYPKGEFLNTLKGLIFKNGFYIHFTLLSNDVESINHVMALSSMLSGINISKHTDSTENVQAEPLEEAYSNYSNGKVRESVAMFEKVVSDNPNNFKAWIGYCLTLKESNRLQSAFIACDKAMSLSPKNPEVFTDLVDLLISARAWEQGLEFSKRVSKIASNQNFVNSINNFAYHAMVVGHLDIAGEAYALIREMGEKSEKLEIDFAIFNHVKNNKLEAINTIEELLRRDTENKEYLSSILKQMKADKPLFDELSFQESYLRVPKRLLELGKEKNINQQPDKWVNKLFPLQGIGVIEIEVPENWYEQTDYAQTNIVTNEIGIRLMDNSLKKIFISVNVNKAEENWNTDNLKELMHSDILKFFKIEENMINQSDNTFIYEKSGIKKNNEAFQMIFKYSLNKSIVSKIVVLDSTSKNSEITDRIINSFRIINPDYTGLKAEKKTNPKSEPIMSKKMANDMPLPEAPANYTWVRMPQIMSAFLKPTDWYEHDKKSNGSHTFALSKESVKQQGSFETGLTVIAIKNVMDKLHFPPYTVSLQMFDGIKQNPSNTIIETRDTSQGPFKSFIVRYENHPEVAKPIIVHKIYIANDKTGSLYIVSFEAPKSEWDEAWKIGETILKYYLVDDEF